MIYHIDNSWKVANKVAKISLDEDEKAHDRAINDAFQRRKRGSRAEDEKAHDRVINAAFQRRKRGSRAEDEKAQDRAINAAFQ